MHYQTATLDELFHISKGKIGIKSSVPGNIPLVTTGETFLSHNEVHFEGDAVCVPLISATGHGHASIKRLHHVQGEFAVGSILCACIVKDTQRVSARFVYYYLTATKNRVLVPLMQGSANVSLKVSDIKTIEIPLPPLAEQQAIVARLDALDAKTRQLVTHLDAIEAAADQLLAQRFQQAIEGAPYRPMAEVAPLVRRNVKLNPTRTYPEVAVRSFGKGLFAKPDFDAATVTWQKPVWIKTGDVVLSNIKAWEGAIAVAGTQHNDCIASHRYITCVPNRDLVLTDFLAYFLLGEEGLDRVGAASPGTADRNRTLSLGNLKKIEIPAPPLEAQRAFVALHARVQAIKAQHADIRASHANLLPATLNRLFADDSFQDQA